MSTKKTKKTKQRSIHQMELAEIARYVYFKRFGAPINDWSKANLGYKDAWRAVVRAVLEEAIYRVEANIK